MKKAINIILYTLCVTITLYLVSCSKGEDGAQGPAGPAGPAGAAGAPGAPGTANVIYSPWIDTLNFLPITDNAGDTIGYFGDINAPKLTLEILNQGDIKVYVNDQDDTDPLIIPIPYNDGLLFIDANFFQNTIELTSNGDLTGLPFRYILIPGGEPARSPNSIDWNNYKEVQKYLG